MKTVTCIKFGAAMGAVQRRQVTMSDCWAHCAETWSYPEYPGPDPKYIDADKTDIVGSAHKLMNRNPSNRSTAFIGTSEMYQSQIGMDIATLCEDADSRPHVYVGFMVLAGPRIPQARDCGKPTVRKSIVSSDTRNIAQDR